MRRFFCTVLCIMLLTLTGVTVHAAEQRAVLTLHVNAAPKQDVTVILRGDDVLVRRADLEEAGLRGFRFNGHGDPSEFISLANLKPDLTFHVDDVNLVLDLTVTSSHLDSNVVDFRPHQDISLSRPARSAFLNYSVSTATQTGAAFAAEAGTHIGSGMFTSTVSFAAQQQYRSNITQWVLDNPSSDRRLTIGDVITSTGDLGGTVSIAGVGVERYFGLDPNSLKTVLPGVTGNALTPSTADIYVNGALYRHEVLPPGQFTFQNLPMGQGPNDTTVVVTDAFGRQQTYTNYFYGADTLLRHGVTDFAYGLGMLHSQFGEQIGHGAAAAGRYAVGITDNVTGGGRLEFGSSLLSIGPSFTFRLPHGVLGVEGSASSAFGATGGAALVSYQHMSPLISSGVSLAVESPHYASLSLQPGMDRATLNATFSIAKQIGRRSGIGLSYIATRDRDNGAQSGWQLTQTSALSDSTQLQVTENLTSGASGKQFGIQTSLYFIPRPGYNASVNASESGGHTQATVQLQRAVSSDTPSFGYTISATGGQGSASGYASADYRGQYGDYTATFAGGLGQGSASVNVAGGVVFIGGRLFPTQSVSDSYALVDSGGLKGVRIMANGVVAGRTDKHGVLLVPRLGSYYNNDITIDSSDTPLNYSIDEQTERIAPMYRSGGIVHFGVNKVRPVTGTLLVRFGSTPVVPAFGIIEVRASGQTITSDIGEGGEFYFEKLGAGSYPAFIHFKTGECRFQMNVPDNAASFLKLGSIVCDNGVKS